MRDKNYWIFIVKDQDGVTGREIYDTLMQAKQWGLGERTPNRKRLEAGDEVVFYLAGSEGQQFLGIAKLASGSIKLTQEEKGKRKQLGSVYDAEYAIDLTDVQKWTEPKPIQPLLDRLEFIYNKENWGSFFQGGIRAISQKDFEIIASPTMIITQPLQIEGERVNEVEFGLETHLQEFIVNNWNKINFGSKLKIYKDSEGNEGQAYPTPIGYIDILAVDEVNGDLVVIELKKGKETDKVVGQTQRYMGWVRRNLLSKGQGIRGIIIVKDYDEKLDLAASENPNIKIMYYKVSFSLSEKH